MATIRIAETLRPTRSHDSAAGGVYPIRAVSLERSRTRSRSRDARSRLSDLKDPDAEDADTGLRQDADFKKRQVRFKSHNWLAGWLCSNLKAGFQGQITALPCLSKHWCDLWRHWNQVWLVGLGHFPNLGYCSVFPV
jgi:hypothetical protein